MKITNFVRFAVLLTVSACSHAPVDRAPADVPVLHSGAGDNIKITPPGNAEHFDVVVVGAGLAGLSSTFYLTEAGKRVLLLEQQPFLGGLAAWGQGEDGGEYDRGAAYWTDPFPEELDILKDIGLGNYEKCNGKTPKANANCDKIPDPIDSYFVRGKYYSDIWREETLEELPASFALFKFELERDNDDGLIPNQPFEEFNNMKLDTMSARQWIESMPQSLKKRVHGLQAKRDLTDDEKTFLTNAKKIWHRFVKEGSGLPGWSHMEDVVELMDLYCRSALGNVASTVSAMAFANFYISEIVPRYTSVKGTGKAADLMVEKLLHRPQFKVVTNAKVKDSGIVNEPAGVTVTYRYSDENQDRWVTADHVIFAGQIFQAPKLVQGLKEQVPKQAAVMTSLGYSHYSVHTVTVKGNPYRSSYDLWVQMNKANDSAEKKANDFTDVILGHWMDPKMKPYYADKTNTVAPAYEDSILTIYHPLSQDWIKKAYSDKQAGEISEFALKRLMELYKELPSELKNGELVVQKLETSKWPFSVHIAAPGHFRTKAKILRHAFGRVHFANNNLGTPAFEEALFRGRCAATNVLKAYDSHYKPEKKGQSPSQCPPDNK